MTEPFDYTPSFGRNKESRKRNPRFHFGVAGIDESSLDREMERHGLNTHSGAARKAAKRNPDIMRKVKPHDQKTKTFIFPPDKNRVDVRSAGAKDIGLQGQQGTLFRVDPSQRTPESRQPRGYSRDRYDQIDAKYHFSSLKNHMNMAASYEDRKDDPLKAQKYRAEAMEAETAHRTLARSTVPKHHMNKLRDINTGHSFDDYGTKGEYIHREDDTGWINIAHGSAGDSTLIHEIGHHVARNKYPNYGSSYPYESGKSEGHAEHYAEVHHRDPGYKRKQPAKEFENKVSPEAEAYPWIHHMRLGLTNGGSDFRRGYREEREPEAITKRSKQLDAGANRKFHGYQPHLSGFRESTLTTEQMAHQAILDNEIKKNR